MAVVRGGGTEVERYHHSTKRLVTPPQFYKLWSEFSILHFLIAPNTTVEAGNSLGMQRQQTMHHILELNMCMAKKLQFVQENEETSYTMSLLEELAKNSFVAPTIIVWLLCISDR